MVAKNITKEMVLAALRTVIDPEVSVNIVDLGLVYGVEVKDGSVKIIMTLTTPMCPLGPLIIDNVRVAVERIEGVKSVDVEVTFDPPWSIEKIMPEVREKLGLGV